MTVLYEMNLPQLIASQNQLLSTFDPFSVTSEWQSVREYLIDINQLFADVGE